MLAMKHVPKIVSFFLLAAACGDNESMTTECQSVGETCVENGCGGGVTAVYYDELTFCEDDAGGDYVLVACDKVQEWAPGATAIRCCCTDTK